VVQYEAAVNLKPEEALYYYKWGQALAQLEQNEAAIMQYQKAIEFDTSHEIRKQAQLLMEAFLKTWQVL